LPSMGASHDAVDAYALERYSAKMSSNTTGIAVRPMVRSLGAEVGPVDLRDLDRNAFELIRGAFLAHSVLVFRHQDLDPDSQIALAKRFGEIYLYDRGILPRFGHTDRPELADKAELAIINNSGRTKEVMTDGSRRKPTEFWHADSTWVECPPAHSFLAVKELPEVGGDTLFASQFAAFDALSDGLQRLLSSLRAVHQSPAYLLSRCGEWAHPVIVTHPENGRKLLYLNPLSVRRFEGMTEAESAGLLQFLFAHQTQPEFVYRHRWEPGDVVMWDNRCLQHYAVDDYADAPRVLVRVSVQGAPPV